MYTIATLVSLQYHYYISTVLKYTTFFIYFQNFLHINHFSTHTSYPEMAQRCKKMVGVDLVNHGSKRSSLGSTPANLNPNTPVIKA